MRKFPTYLIITIVLIIIDVLVFNVAPAQALKIETFYASNTAVKAGESFNLASSISHTKELGMVYLIRNGNVINQSSSCDGLKKCAINFPVTETIPGSYQYYITAMTKSGSANTSSNYITITVSGKDINSTTTNACKVEQKINNDTIIWEDSDCGKNYDSYGEIKYTVKETGYTQYATKDTCSIQPQASNYLVEFYLEPISANNSQVLKSETYYCSNGCQNGACIKTKRIEQSTESLTTNIENTNKNFSACQSLKEKYGIDLAEEAISNYDENEDGYISPTELAAGLLELKEISSTEIENKIFEFLKEYSQNNCRDVSLFNYTSLSSSMYNDNLSDLNNYKSVINLDPNEKHFCAKAYTLDRIANSKGNLSSVVSSMQKLTLAKKYLKEAGLTASEAVNEIAFQLNKSPFFNYFNDYNDQLTYSASCELDLRINELKSQFKQRCGRGYSFVGSRFCRTLKQGRNINVSKFSNEGMKAVLNNLANLSDTKKRQLDHFIKSAVKKGIMPECAIRPQFIDRDWLRSLYAIKQDLTWIWSPSFGSIGGNAGGSVNELIQGRAGNWFAPLLDLHGGAGSTDYKALVSLAQAGIFKAPEIKDLLQWHFEKIYKPTRIVYYYTFYKGNFGNVSGPGLVKYLTLKDENIASRVNALNRALSLLKTTKDCDNALSIKPIWNALKTFEPPKEIPQVPADSGLPSNSPGYPEFLKDSPRSGFFDIRDVLFSVVGTKGSITPLSTFGY